MSAKSPAAAKKIVLVDGTNSMYRAFFAIPHLRAPDGSPTNAAYGFINMLSKVIREQAPDQVIVIFDHRGKNFRHHLYDAYKAGRDATPEDLSVQFSVVRELVEAFRIPIVSVPDFEADDVIATLVERAPKTAKVAIVSTDKDLMQLVSDRVTLLDGVKDREYGPADVEERFGVPPEQILDLRSLLGDPSDNIPGVKGIGAKGAAKLISEWKTLENLIEHRAEITGARARNALESQVEEARLSKRLSTMRTDVPLPAELEAARLEEPDNEALRVLYERLGFVRLIDALGAQPGEGMLFPEGEASNVKVDRIQNAAGLEKLVTELRKQPLISLGCVLGESAPMTGAAVGVVLALGAERAAFLAVGSGADQFSLESIAQALSPVLEGKGAIGWMAVDAKQAQIVLGEHGLELGPAFFDLGIAAQLLNPSGAKTVTALALRELGRKVRSWTDLAGRGAKAIAACDLPIADVATWAAEEVCALVALQAPLAASLERDGLAPLCDEVELPLTGVLAHMERLGVRVDESLLEKLSEEWGGRLESIQARIYELAGEEFLISSPKQLQKILFEKLKLPPSKKTKTGFSTDSSVLTHLAHDHELPSQILVYRGLAKLRSTYVDALPPLVNPASGRIHPTFHQLGAATGRMSATDPNVQNIPIRSEEGIRIREAFIAAEGNVLLSADYSQIELRLLAHFSEDATLLDAFQNGEDIHRRTAAEVAGVELDAVTPAMRDRAKAVNFGIIYGTSAFGLANQLKIASADAQATIDAYFARYPGIQAFMAGVIETAKERGFVQTLLGRRRYLPDLGSRNRTLRMASERMAVNSVVQGTAADLIKKAMLDVEAGLAEASLSARMMLQVHDELVFEVSPAEVTKVTEVVRDRMEAVLALRVPLQVDVGVGANWREAH